MMMMIRIALVIINGSEMIGFAYYIRAILKQSKQQQQQQWNKQRKNYWTQLRFRLLKTE